MESAHSDHPHVSNIQALNMSGTNKPENDFDLIWCDDCDAMQPVERENIGPDLDGVLFGDLICSNCRLVLITVSRSFAALPANVEASESIDKREVFTGREVTIKVRRGIPLTRGEKKIYADLQKAMARARGDNY